MTDGGLGGWRKPSVECAGASPTLDLVISLMWPKHGWMGGWSEVGNRSLWRSTQLHHTHNRHNWNHHGNKCLAVDIKHQMLFKKNCLLCIFRGGLFSWHILIVEFDQWLNRSSTRLIFWTLSSEKATDGSLQAEDWTLNMEICDIINETDEGSAQWIWSFLSSHSLEMNECLCNCAKYCLLLYTDYPIHR